jgi:hypothetical protein
VRLVSAPKNPAERPSTGLIPASFRRPAIWIAYCIIWMVLVLIKMPNLGPVWVDVAALVTAGAALGFNVARLRPRRGGGSSSH